MAVVCRRVHESIDVMVSCRLHAPTHFEVDRATVDRAPRTHDFRVEANHSYKPRLPASAAWQHWNDPTNTTAV